MKKAMKKVCLHKIEFISLGEKQNNCNYNLLKFLLIKKKTFFFLFFCLFAGHIKKIYYSFCKKTYTYEVIKND